MIALSLGMLAMLCSLVTGCTASKLNTPYVFVYLKSGPNSGQGDKETRQNMFAGHMANIKRLAAERKLCIAGPYDSPTDKTLRGIFVMDVATSKEATALAASDPGVAAGEFIAECHEMKSTSALRDMYALEEQLQAELKTQPNTDSPGTLPPGLRKYVLVTTANYHKAIATLRSAKREPTIIWSGRFTDSSHPAGVIVLDSDSPQDVREVLKECEVDGWWSTKAVEKLRR